MNIPHKQRTMLFLCVLAMLEPVIAQGQYSSRIDIDWSTAHIHATLSLDLHKAGIRLPSGRTLAEHMIDSELPTMLRAQILTIGLDSYRTIEDSLLDGSISPSDLDAYLSGGRKLSSSLSSDMKSLIVSYEFSLIDLVSLYVKHSRPIESAVAETYTPTRPYSGILVYIQGEYPVRGEHRTGTLEPCLFPRIYDDTMTPILERNFMYPEALLRYGSVGWAESLDDDAVELRIGEDPLRLIASAIFGARRSDVILSRADALKILASPENRDLVKQGKVIFIYSR